MAIAGSLCAAGRMLALLALLCGVAGCALTTDEIAVEYGAPRATPAPVPGASEVSVAVAARDARTAYRDRVSTKRNGYGMEMAPIVATNDVIAETARAIAAELAARGFAPGGRDARVEIDVLRFYNDFKPGFWAGSATAELLVNLRVLDRAGRVVFLKTYHAEGHVPALVIYSGENARTALVEGLRNLVHQVADNPALIAALTAQAPPAAEPPPPPRRRPGRPVS
ncbi:YajG family lipoprotein [Caldovatus aquaticus]|uniref:YajG family lipoprotein n=1 Tax=Caldovatus aquaticus TaxID=2865671 RepID=A0ABS7F545_9PROT|nr:YajG family lipoprotein [Caldovatus aquaticus]MBW8270747.1 YajG family lipoprotein [Caldovatus aquaticus]